MSERFGRRRGNRSTQQPSHWLSPDAYDALSTEEKRKLWAERKKQQARSGWNERSRRTSESPWSGWVMVAVLVGGAAAWELSSQSWSSSPAATASGATEVRRSFGLCHSGGGTNCVVDGDTIWLDGQNIRLADIDAPETHEPRCADELALGNRATNRLHELVNSGAVSLRSVDRDEDRYGRKLRIVLVNGESVGDTLVNEGLVRWYGSGRQPWC